MSGDGVQFAYSANAPRGAKRRGDDTINNGQRLAKRFHSLNLGSKKNDRVVPAATVAPEGAKANSTPQQSDEQDVSPMQVDDTKTRVYISSLDEELESVDVNPSDGKITVLPNIEREISRIPKHVLVGEDKPRVTGTELILYAVPSSLSVAPEHDSVRRAILESRARMSKRATQDAQLHDGQTELQGYKEGNDRLPHPQAEDHDEDTMEIG